MKNNVILGYPRSANNWVRYLIEFFSTYETRWMKQDTVVRRPLHHIVKEINSDNKGNLIFWNAHSYAGCHSQLHQNPIQCKLILPIRNYKEVLKRQHYPNHSVLSVKEMHSLIHKLKSNYMSLLSTYDEHPGPKLLIYYEDVISHTSLKNVLEKLCEFLEVNDKDAKIERFFEKYEGHVGRCKNIYKKNLGGSKSDAKSAIWHSKALSDLQKKVFDNIVRSQYPHLHEGYLKRYEE